jgi:hypothetical protein
MTSAKLSLPRGPQTPSTARRVVRNFCTHDDAAFDHIDDAARIAGELAFISARQSRAPAISLVLERTQQRFVVRVVDQATHISSMRMRNSASAERSWAVVRDHASAWGVSVTESGRELWAALEPRGLAQSAEASAGSLG